MLNKKTIGVFVILFILSILIIGAAESAIADEIVIKSPFIVTSAGQSTCYQLFNSILKQYELEAEEVNNLIVAEDLENKNSLVLVIGGNYKSLEKFEMKPGDELNRTKKLIDEAKNKNLKVVAVYLGQLEGFNEVTKLLMKNIFPASDYIITIDTPEINELLFELEEEYKIHFNITDRLIKVGEAFISVLEGAEVGVCYI